MAWQEDLAVHIAGGFDGDWEFGRNVVIGPPEDDEATDDLCIGLVDRPGPVDETFSNVYGRPNLTVVVRSAPMAAKDGSDIAQALFLWLTRIANEVIGTTPIQRLEPRAWPGRLRRDQSKRTDYTMEIGVWLGEF